jgi:hypothetical protein
MSDTRFRWSAVDNLTALYELKARGFTREATFKNAGCRCYAKACGHPGQKIRVGDLCYIPTPNTGPQNKVVAHVDCVDRAVAANTAKTADQAREALVKSKGLLTLETLSAASMKARSAKPVARGFDPLDQLAAIRQRIYEEGYQAGISAALAALEGELPGKSEGRHQ